jgi:glycerate kinase
MAMGGAWVEVETVDALGRPVRGKYMWVERERVAVVEMSEASGLWRLMREELAPELAHTRGTGLLMRDAAERGARRILVGLGGSATTDGGMGMARALGWRFWDAEGRELEGVARDMGKVFRVEKPPGEGFPEVVAACDVRNPLLGPRGTAAVYAPQKGADASMVACLEGWLGNFADRVAECVGRDHRELEGAGAAGGIGFGLVSFCGARMEPGFELVADAVGLREGVAWADVVLTGEGRLDGQTLEGKGPAGVARLARAAGRRVVAFAGSVEDGEAVGGTFDAVVPVVDSPMSLEAAMAGAAQLLERAASRAARLAGLNLR